MVLTIFEAVEKSGWSCASLQTQDNLLLDGGDERRGYAVENELWWICDF